MLDTALLSSFSGELPTVLRVQLRKQPKLNIQSSLGLSVLLRKQLILTITFSLGLLNAIRGMWRHFRV